MQKTSINETFTKYETLCEDDKRIVLELIRSLRGKEAAQ